MSPRSVPDRVEARVGVVVALHAAREVERAVAVVGRARVPVDEGLRLGAEAEVLLAVHPHGRGRHHELVQVDRGGFALHIFCRLQFGSSTELGRQRMKPNKG